MSDSTIKIRGHHVFIFKLLSRKFGKGNNPKFDQFPNDAVCIRDIPLIGGGYDIKKCVAEIYQNMINNPKLKVAIVNTVDDICAVCNHHNDAVCIDYTPISEHDNRWADHFGLEYKTYAAKDLLNIIEGAN